MSNSKPNHRPLSFLDTRFILVHKHKGVYLGPGLWSALGPGEAKSAPTFAGFRDPLLPQVVETETPRDVDRELHEDHAAGLIQPVQVIADVGGVRASPDACREAGVIGWTPGVGPQNPDLGLGG